MHFDFFSVQFSGINYVHVGQPLPLPIFKTFSFPLTEILNSLISKSPLVLPALGKLLQLMCVYEFACCRFFIHLDS